MIARSIELLEVERELMASSLALVQVGQTFPFAVVRKDFLSEHVPRWPS